MNKLTSCKSNKIVTITIKLNTLCAIPSRLIQCIKVECYTNSFLTDRYSKHGCPRCDVTACLDKKARVQQTVKVRTRVLSKYLRYYLVDFGKTFEACTIWLDHSIVAIIVGIAYTL